MILILKKALWRVWRLQKSLKQGSIQRSIKLNPWKVDYNLRHEWEIRFLAQLTLTLEKDCKNMSDYFKIAKKQQ